MGWLGMDLNATALVASRPENEQPGLGSGEKDIQVLTQTASLL